MNHADAGPLPSGTRILHIGPHQTGTEALQSAFHAHRDELEVQGVHYAGANRQAMTAADAVTGTPSAYADGKVPPEGRWRALAGEVTGSPASRVVISSEGFADGDPAAIERVVRDLDRSRLQVVITLRPLAAVLPLQWGALVQEGMTLAYEGWLREVLEQPGGAVAQSFWRRHRHDQLVARWAAAVGPGRVTVVIGDEGDHASGLRAFEQLLELRAGTLVPEPNLGDRSLTLPEAESLRAFNAAFRAEGLGTQLHARVIRFGAAELLKQRAPADGEPGIETPQWALDRAAEIGREIVDGINASGVRVVGDLASLAATPPAATATSSGTEYDIDAVWADVGATIALGIVLASGLAKRDASRAWSQIPWPDGLLAPGRRPPRARVEPLELARVSTPRLGVILVRRFLGAAAARLRPARRAS